MDEGQVNMTNEEVKTADEVRSHPNDEEAKDSPPDHSATLKDIELKLLRELLKDETRVAAGSAGSHEALGEALKEIHDRNRRNLTIVIGVVFLAISILSFAGYSKLASLRERELESRQEIRSIEDHVESISKRVESISKQHESISNEEECTLGGTSNSGKVVFYPRGEPEAYQAGERVCILSATYPWTCEREALQKYIGKKVFLSIAGFERGLYMDFTVIGFFSPVDQSRMIQIPMSSLENLVGVKKAEKYIAKGVLDGWAVFPE